MSTCKIKWLTNKRIKILKNINYQNIITQQENYKLIKIKIKNSIDKLKEQ